MENEGLKFEVVFVKAQTMIDGGWRITFDLSDNEAKVIPILTELRHQLLQIEIVPSLVSEPPLDQVERRDFIFTD
jgi:hypothetical protein